MRLAPLYARNGNVATMLLVALLENKSDNRRGIEFTCWEGIGSATIDSWIDVHTLWLVVLICFPFENTRQEIHNTKATFDCLRKG